MTVIEQIAPPLPVAHKAVSRRLTEPLRMVAGRARVLAFFRACFQLLVLTAAGWLVIVLILGTLRKVPVYVAIPLALAAWGTVVFGALRFFGQGRVFRRRDLSSAARLVDVALPATQERISSAVEISQETDGRFRGSPELVACLIRQAEKDADKLDPNAVVSGRSVLRWLEMLVPLLALWFVLLVVKTPNILLGLQRTLQPWTAAIPLPGAILEVEPGNITVAQGDRVEIKLNVKPALGASENADPSGERASIIRRFADGDQELATEMNHTGPRTFMFGVDNVEQSFSYRLSSQGAQSPAFNVTVQGRPAVTGIEVAYEYPKYTHQDPRIDKSRDGAIDALVGTRVKITVEATEPLKSARLVIADNAPNSGNLDMTSVAAAPAATRYSTAFTLIKSTQYRIELVNAQNLQNRDNQSRPITARIDTAPQISILSPGATLKVRPDDTVPIDYSAKDDYGITKIEALLQVDELPQSVVAIPLTGVAQIPIEHKWDLAVAQVLLGVPAAANARRISYQLRVTDNCEPSAQTGLSARQTLEIDKGVIPLAQRQDAEAIQTLAEAIKKAQADLADARRKLDDVKNADASKPLGEKEKQAAADAHQRIAQARKDLSDAANKSADSRLTDPAHEARQIADDPLRQAQEKAADAQLAADQPAARQQDAQAAQQDIDDAQKKLNALAQRLDQAARDQPLAQELERIAAQQRQLADAMERHPQDQKLKDEQKELQDRLEKLIKDNPELQKPVAQANQATQDDLVKRIQQLEQAQQPLSESLKNQAAAPATKEQVKGLAQQQSDLNREIEAFRGQQDRALKDAGAKTPEKPQLESIVKDLQGDHLENAAQSQRAAGVQLDEAAARLDAVEKRQQENAGTHDKAQRQAQQAVKETGALKQQADQLADQIEQAKKDHNPPTRPSDPANQQAAAQAEELKKAAQQMAQMPGFKQAAQDAGKAADAAKREAGRGNAAAAQQQLASGAAALAEAARAAAAGAAPAAAQDPGAAAAQARALAQKQQSLAEQTARAGKALESAADAQAHASEESQQQQQLSEKIEQTAKDAQSLEQQTRGAAPEMSQRAGKAAQSLQESATAQRASAKSMQQGNASRAAADQQRSAEQLAAAAEALTGQPSASGNKPRETTSGQPQNQGGPSAAANGGMKQQPGENHEQGRSSPNQGQGQVPGQTASGGQGQGQSGAGQGQTSGPGAGQTPGNGQGQAQGQGAAQTANGGQRQGAGGQGQAPNGEGQDSGQDLAQGSGTGSGQGTPQGQSQGPGAGNSQGRGQGTGAGQSGAQAGSGGAGQSSGNGSGLGSSASSGGENGQGSASSESGSGGQSDQGIARAVQEARTAQSQAAGGDAAAARQAAEQLGQASRQLSAESYGRQPGSRGGAPGGNTPGMSAGPGQGDPGKSITGAPANGSGDGQATGNTRGQGSGAGITLTEGPRGAPPEPPKPVQDIGISPSDWARLPANMQEQLLHSAQQSGPPAYHDMIKNYYSRIARLQTEEPR